MEKVIVRDNNARLTAVGYLSLPALLLFSMIFIIPLVFIYGIDRLSNSEPMIAILVATIATELTVVLVSLMYAGYFTELKKSVSKVKDFLGFKNFIGKHQLVAIGIAVVFFVGLASLELIAKQFEVEVGNSATADAFAAMSGLEKYIILFLFVSFIVPIVEEIVFRGFILGSLMTGHEAWGKKINSVIVVWVIIFSSFCFSILHFQGASTIIDFIVLLWTFLFGIAAAIMRIKYNSLYPAITSHAIYNFMGALSLAFLG